PGLWREIEASVATDPHREEVSDVRRTIADELKEQGGIETARRTLTRLLRRRFGEVPDDTIAVIEATTDLEKLDGWLDRFATATTLQDVGIQ
ncbi:MAG: hypothetical protein JXQ29_10130, partial [Planctomycetes bacterium]|nr:hypothetical protein [Planctomycetota bacterium]